MGAFGPNIPQLDAKVKKLSKDITETRNLASFIFQTLRKQDQILALHDSVLESLKDNLINKGLVTAEEYTALFEESKKKVKERAEAVIKEINTPSEPVVALDVSTEESKEAVAQE